MNFYRGLPFAQVREDAEVELWLARQQPIQRGLIIASAGCTAFALAAQGGEWIALDSNPEQLRLCQHKAQLLREPRARERILPLLRRGRIDRMLDRMAWLYRKLLLRERRVVEFFELDDVELQRRDFACHWQGVLWRSCFRLVVGQPLFWLRWVFGPLVGSFPRSFAEQLRLQVETALCSTPARRNPYMSQLFLARFPDNVWPPYLEDLQATRAGLLRLHWEAGDVVAWMDSQPAGQLDFLGLSNVLELADEAGVAELARSAARAGRTGALVVLRRIIATSYRPQVEPWLEFRSDLSAYASTLERGCFCRTIEVYQVGTR